jgi:hypothetical protein
MQLPRPGLHRLAELRHYAREDCVTKTPGNFVTGNRGVSDGRSLFHGLRETWVGEMRALPR